MDSPTDTQSDALPLVSLVLDASALAGFAALLQQGVAVPARLGVSIAAFLTEQLHVDPAVVAARISTVFLDGDVVDSLERATIHEGSVLALSAAMPGLVGATLRRGGFYASMRSGITRADDAPAQASGASAGTIRLKLFNLLIAELGPCVLAHGLVVDPGTARAALALHPLGALPDAERILLRVSLVPPVRPCA